ncbi:hypothetical protein M9H77_24254 [Catharanthus roseus]|uniref:Uncharacterized protein n=1 Tax=Catharanthus roseus TaxID=4058 RepID=A0ACC0AVY9_CATRO|nr:hypothetical protein M9H77_24254 [Catharanthus roseus]
MIQEPPSSPSQMAVFAKKVQTNIQRCMVSNDGTLGCTSSQHDIQQMFLVQLSRRRPQEHVPDWGARGVKRDARRQPGRGAGGGALLYRLFQADANMSTPGMFSEFRAPPPPGTASSSTPHQQISQASSSNEEERTDDMDVVQHY